jgi:hypothetical protein
MALGANVWLVLELARGIYVIQDADRPVSPVDALYYATAAAFHAERNGVDAFELIGIARNESDFRPHLVSPDGLDCGITQIRVRYSRYRCRDLRDDVWIAFEEAARELAENEVRCARRTRGDTAPCRLNSYNSGVRYARSGWSGRYWLRIRCFAEAARRGVTPNGDCRRVRGRDDIERLLTPSEGSPVGAATTSLGGEFVRGRGLGEVVRVDDIARISRFSRSMIECTRASPSSRPSRIRRR